VAGIFSAKVFVGSSFHHPGRRFLQYPQQSIAANLRNSSARTVTKNEMTNLSLFHNKSYNFGDSNDSSNKTDCFKDY
jgi:hypothetical protein